MKRVKQFCNVNLAFLFKQVTNLWKFLSSCLLGKSWQQNSFKICVHFWKLEVKKLITLRTCPVWEIIVVSLSLSFQKNGMSCALFFFLPKLQQNSSWPLQVSWKDLKNASGITSSDLLLLYAWQFQNIGLCIRQIFITEKMAPRFWQFSDIQSQ